MIAKVYVSPKTTVLDPQGSVVASSLRKLGYDSISKVHVGKYIVLELGDVESGAAETLVDEMCRRFLANPIIEDYRFELSED